MDIHEHKVNAYSHPVININPDSINQLRRDFKNIKINTGKYYDDRIYFDGHDEYYPYMFSKTLDHNKTTGFAKKKDVDTIINASQISDTDSINNISTSSIPFTDRRLIEGMSSSQSHNFNDYYLIDNLKSTFEMGEVYFMQLLRNTTFYDIENNTNGINNIYLNDLNSFKNNITAPTDNSVITNKLLFRGNSKYDKIGPYISQYLYLPFNYGCLPMNQKFNSILENNIIDDEKWLLIQNGKKMNNIYNLETKYIHTPSILSSKVHNDSLFQVYYNAAMISFQNNIKPSDFTNVNSSIWTSTGVPDILDAVSQVGLGVLRSAWFNKCNISMRIRPEVFAQRINLIKKSMPGFINKIPGFNNINNNITKISNILNKIYDNQSNYHLTTLYNEGSLTHPSCPSGHACIAGACVTVLKAMLDTHDDNGTPKSWPSCKFNTKSGEISGVCHSIDGNDLEIYNTKENLTIVGELNKLASNVSIGRNFAGVHYRCDGLSGLNMGEQFAITYLIDKAKEYNESYNNLFKYFILEKFDGTKIKINAFGTTQML